MTKRVLYVWSSILVLQALVVVPLLWAQSMGMVTGSETGTYFRFGQDIARVAQSVGLEILVKESEGSIDNIRRLISAENAALGIVQSDVLGFLSRSPDPYIRQIADQLRLIFPFYNEEVHLLARKTIQRFEDLAGKRVAVGTEGSGNWLTANNLLRMLAIQPAELVVNLPPPEAVHAVLTGQIDAMFYVAGKPVKLFANVEQLRSDPRYTTLVQEVHFVPLDHQRMLQEYLPSSIDSADYAWLDTTVPTVAVKAVLISFDFTRKNTAYYRQRCQHLTQLATAVRHNFAELQRTGHAKWKEVDLDQKLNIWQLDACSQTARAEVTPKESLQKEFTDILKRTR